MLNEQNAKDGNDKSSNLTLSFFAHDSSAVIVTKSIKNGKTRIGKNLEAQTGRFEFIDR